MQNAKKGFSLLELLVVFGIITLLGMLFMPLLGHLREKTKRVRCVNNLRQFGTALQMYLDDNKDKFPTDTGFSSEKAWFNALPPYLNLPKLSEAMPPPWPESGKSIFVCPSEKIDDYSGSRPGRPSYFSSYALNAAISGKSLRRSNIKDPSCFVFLAETPNGRKTTINKDEMAGSDGETGSYRHRAYSEKADYANICFADGHVDSFSGADVSATNSVVIWELNADAGAGK